MSKKIDIKLKKADIYKKVQIGSEYAGAKDADSTLYERIVVQDENFDMLDNWWEDGIFAVVETLSHYVGEEEETSTTTETTATAESYDIDFVLEMPDNWRDKGNNICNLIKAYMTNYLLAKWMIEVKMADNAQIYAGDAAAAMKDIRTSLKARKRPSML